MDKTDAINDYKDTVKRLQQECTEKTDAIIVLAEQLHHKEQELADLKRNLKLEKIKEKWQELINMSPLELATNAKKMLELDNIIKGEENE